MDGKIEALILAKGKHQLPIAYRVYDKLSLAHKKNLILTMDEEIIGNNYLTKSLQHYQRLLNIRYLDIEQERYNLFYSIAEQKIGGQTTLNELTTYKGVSLWELSAVYIFSELGAIMYYINIIEAILDFEKPSQVHIIDEVNDIEKILKLVCEKKKIPIFLYKNESKKSLSLNKVFGRNIIFLKRLKKTLLSLYFLCINFKKSIRLDKQYDIIFFAPPERFFDSMLPVIFQYNTKQRLVIDIHQFGCSKKMKKKKLFYMDFHGYELYDLFGIKSGSFLKKIKAVIYNDNAFLSKITYNTLPLGPLLYGIFERLIYEQFPEKIRDIDAARKIILSYKPKTIVVCDCSFDITLIAKSLSIPVVALQAGHADEFICFSPVKADAIAVEGNYWRQYLCEKGVDMDKIWVTGDPKLDVLQDSIYRKKDGNSGLRLDGMPTKKTVVFATICRGLAFGMLDFERVEQIYVLFGAMKNIKDAHLVIKLHPYDSDLSLYKRIAKETGLSNLTIVKDEDILKLLNRCDVLIAHWSKLSYLAVLMDKNTIFTTYSSIFHSADFWDFKRYGVAITVDDLKELESHIRNALFDRETEIKLKENRKKYIFEHAYKMDGRAAERVKGIIDRFT